MPRAEVGSTKYLSNKLKSKGLQRLRWYCQVCERQMRDENGFKMHTQSEGHVRNMLLVGENAKTFISDYSNQFKRDFLLLLRTAHGEKPVQINHFYQEYIANKEHVHMNATRWNSLTEFAKFLGREGICRVEDNEKGIHIAWIDNSPEALRRQDAIRKKERQDKGDEEWEQRQIREQIRKAQKSIEAQGVEDEQDLAEEGLKRDEGEKIKLSFGSSSKTTTSGKSTSPVNKVETATSASDVPAEAAEKPSTSSSSEQGKTSDDAKKEPAAEKVTLKMGFQSKPKNVFAVAKKNALGGKKAVTIEQPKKMSEAERIMKEELERKRSRDSQGFGNAHKRQRF